VRDDIIALSALSLSASIKQRQISCREVMLAYLEQITLHNPRVNALVSLRPDDELLREADQYDRELARGEYRGWLHGIPQAPKDLAACKGFVTSMGSPLFARQITAHDAYPIQRMRKGAEHQRMGKRPGLAGNIAHLADFNASLFSHFTAHRRLECFSLLNEASKARKAPSGKIDIAGK